MILVILAFSVVLVFGGLAIADRGRQQLVRDFGSVLSILGAVCTGLSLMAAVVLSCEVMATSIIDAEIDIYKASNVRLEEQIASGDLDVASEIAENNRAIKELEIERVNGTVYRWWLYFGD